jgi:hypothetical protein
MMQGMPLQAHGPEHNKETQHSEGSGKRFPLGCVSRLGLGKQVGYFRRPNPLLHCSWLNAAGYCKLTAAMGRVVT